MEVAKVLACLVVTLLAKLTRAQDEDQQGIFKECPDLSESCLKNTIQTVLPVFMVGVPEFGLESLDPFQVKNLELKLPGGLTINFSKGVAKGFKDCSVMSAKLIRDHLEVKIQCNLTIQGKYTSSGRLLFFPVNGDGDALIKCNKLQMTASFKIGTRLEGNRQEHLYIKRFKSSHKFEGRVTYEMTNIFKGNPQISKAVLEFINSNWRLVAEEFGKPIVDVGVNAIKRNIDLILQVVPSYAFVGASDIFK